MSSKLRTFLQGVALSLVALALPTARAAAQPVQVPARFQPPTSWADLADAAGRAVVSIQAMALEAVDPGLPDDAGDEIEGDEPPERPQEQPQHKPDDKPQEKKGVDPFEFFFGEKKKPEAAPEAKETPRAAPPQPAPAPAKPPAPGAKPQLKRNDTGGSGFLISRDGLVVTNYHVIDGMSRITVHLGTRDYPAEVRGTDRATDLALLQIHAGGDLPYFELADSDAVRVGDWLMVIGNPLNLDKTVTTGVVSAKGRSIGISDTSFENFIQTDAAINFGNSGGPLIDMQGRVVAIATAINYGAENIGFAVPINTLKAMLPQLRDKGRVSRGYLGAAITALDPARAPAFGVDGGVLVGSVTAGAPAEQGGIRHGDVLLAVDGRQLATTHDLIDYVSAKGPGATVTVLVVRDGKPFQRQITLQERPGDLVPTAPPALPAPAWPSLRVENWSATAARNADGTPAIQGVKVTEVELASTLYEQGVRAGCVISEVNGRPVQKAAELEQALADAKPGSYIRLYVWRFGRGGRATPFFAVVQTP